MTTISRRRTLSFGPAGLTVTTAAGGDEDRPALAAGRVLVGQTDGSLIANAVLGEVRRVGTGATGTEGRIVIR